jgi:hypothetical protein
MPDNLFVTKDPLRRTIRLTEQCYRLHIVIEHPDLFDVGEIERTVRSPEVITEDAQNSSRLVYYRTYQRSPQRWMVKVVVEQGEIVTAYRVKRVKQGEVILWQR